MGGTPIEPATPVVEEEVKPATTESPTQSACCHGACASKAVPSRKQMRGMEAHPAGELLDTIKSTDAKQYFVECDRLVREFTKSHPDIFVQKIRFRITDMVLSDELSVRRYNELQRKYMYSNPYLCGYVVVYSHEGHICIGLSEVPFHQAYSGKIHRNKEIWRAIRFSKVQQINEGVSEPLLSVVRRALADHMTWWKGVPTRGWFHGTGVFKHAITQYYDQVKKRLEYEVARSEAAAKLAEQKEANTAEVLGKEPVAETA